MTICMYIIQLKYSEIWCNNVENHKIPCLIGFLAFSYYLVIYKCRIRVKYVLSFVYNTY